MRNIYDGPTTGRHSLLPTTSPARSSKSLDLPRPAGTADAAADLGGAGGGAKALADSPLGRPASPLRRTSTAQGVPIPGAFNADGSPQLCIPRKANMAAFLHLITPDPPRPRGAHSVASSPPAERKLGGLPPQSARDPAKRP